MKAIYVKFIPRLLLLTIAIVLATSVHSQDFYKARRFFFGLKGGVNFTLPIVVRSYNVFSEIPGTPNGTTPKLYTPMFENLGGQFGVIGLYYFNNFLGLTFQPMYYNYNFSYLNQYTWMDANQGTQVDVEYTHYYKLFYFELPVMVRYDILPGRFTPYLQAGGFFGILHQGTHSTAYTSTYDVPLQPDQDPPQTPFTSVTPNLNRVSVGVIGGLGLCYNTNFVQIGLEANMRYGFIPISNPRNRYTDESGAATGYYDVMDDIQLLNLEISLTAIFPIGPGDGGSGSKPYCSFQKKTKKYKKKRR